MSARHVLLPLAAMLCAAGLIGGCGDSSDETTMSLIEHAETDTVRHIGPAKEEDSVGDILAFANPVFDAENKKQVGTDNGSCVRTAAGKAWECIWTADPLAAGRSPSRAPSTTARTRPWRSPAGPANTPTPAGRCSCTPATRKKPSTTSPTKSKTRPRRRAGAHGGA